jgi:uncharacterized protein (DUF952 family)
VVLIYKILLPSEWAQFEAAGRFGGSPFDLTSGFIHTSTREQVSETALRVFPQEPALVVVAVDTERLADPLRWEAASEGVFPHVYGEIPVSAVAAVYPVPGAAAVDQALPTAEPES